MRDVLNQRAVEAEPQVEVLYRAFISYSHSADSNFAPHLQTALQGFGKRWYLPRAFRIFRDTTNLSLAPELWPEIETALEASEFLLFLASPAAAQSKWVKKELAYWKERKSRSKLLIILTSGKVAWDDALGDFDPILSTAIPPELYHTFDHEPFWLDFSTLQGSRLSMSDAQFLDHIATVAASLHGKTKDQMFGEHIRQRRRIVQLVTLAVLLLLGAFLIALWQWQVAVEERENAVKQEAEVRRTLSRADFTAAASLFQQDESHAALLHLIRAVRQDPANTSAAQRLVSALLNRRWPVLAIPPMDAGGSMRDAQFLAAGKKIVTTQHPGTSGR